MSEREEMIDLSIIVPVYNVEEFLQECIESIIDNDYESKEVILVDDGSTDNSGRICDSYAQKYDYIKVLHKKNGGLSSARNHGIEFASGEYLGFVDSDDIIDHNMYSEMMSHAKLHNADMVVCGIYNYYSGEKENTVAVHAKSTVVYEDNKKYSLFIDHNGMGDYAVNKIYRKSLFGDTIRFPQGKSFEDIYTSYKLYERAKKVVCIDKDLYYYRYRLDSISRSSVYNPNMINIMLSTKEQYEFIKKNAKEYIPQASQKFLDGNMLFLNHMYSNKMIKKEKKQVKMLRDNVNTLLNESCTYDRFYQEARSFSRSVFAWSMRKKITRFSSKLITHPRFYKAFMLVFGKLTFQE